MDDISKTFETERSSEGCCLEIDLLMTLKVLVVLRQCFSRES
ncbi:MAG: hypothetical protein PHE02_11805 [Lachnospiraceae bacterium]|nr:hypothetical protein [Lachnospiraceae bacterium]